MAKKKETKKPKKQTAKRAKAIAASKSLQSAPADKNPNRDPHGLCYFVIVRDPHIDETISVNSFTTPEAALEFQDEITKNHRGEATYFEADSLGILEQTYPEYFK